MTRRPELPANLRGSVVIVAALVVLTAGAAAPLWFWYRAVGFNRLAALGKWKRAVPQVRRDLSLLAFGTLVFATFMNLLPNSQPTAWQFYLSLAGNCILLIQAVTAARILRRIGESYELGASSIFAVILAPLSPIYFQWKLNRLVARANQGKLAAG